MKSMAEDDADLDSMLLLECLRNDSEEIFYVRVNNLALEKTLLMTLFETLKTTKTMRHLSLAGIHLKDEDGLVSRVFLNNLNYKIPDDLYLEVKRPTI